MLSNTTVDIPLFFTGERGIWPCSPLEQTSIWIAPCVWDCSWVFIPSACQGKELCCLLQSRRYDLSLDTHGEAAAGQQWAQPQRTPCTYQPPDQPWFSTRLRQGGWKGWKWKFCLQQWAVVGYFFLFFFLETRDTDINTQRFCSVLFLQQVHSSTAMAYFPYFPGTFPVSLSLTAWQLWVSLFPALTHFTFFTSLSEILKKTSELSSQHLTASFLFSLAMSVLPLAPHIEQGCLQHTHPSQL